MRFDAPYEHRLRVECARAEKMWAEAYGIAPPKKPRKPPRTAKGAYRLRLYKMLAAQGATAAEIAKAVGVTRRAVTHADEIYHFLKPAAKG